MHNREERILCKRAYDKPTRRDGYRLLVDRLWPRGVSKSALKLDEWDKSLAPSDELRLWFNHDTAKWNEFCHKYHQELYQCVSEERLHMLLTLARRQGLTLIYAARDTEHNNAVALRLLLKEHALSM